MANILFLDNFDSFTYNLVDQFRVLGHNVTIYRNDCDLEKLVETALNTPDTILALSPGPGTPSEAGILLPLIERLKNKVPIIGICLGHQALIQPLAVRLFTLAKCCMVKFLVSPMITKPCLKILLIQCLWRVIIL